MTAARRLLPLGVGYLTLPTDSLVEGATGTRRIPFPAFLIEHGCGLAVYDTGLSALAYDDPSAYFGTDSPFRPEFTPDQRIDRRLAKYGYRPADVSHVILSHAHSDHTGGLTLFPHARFYVGPGELEWARNAAEPSAKHVRFVEHIEPALGFDWHESTHHDIFDDGSVVTIHTPGHTPGHLSLAVRLPSRTVVLTGDATHLREGIERRAIDPIDVDPNRARASLALLAELEHGTGELWIAHDPDDWERLGNDTGLI